MYLNESNRGIGELWASIQAGDWDQSERLAHRIGGSASMCGMVGLVAPLRAIEIAARSGRWSRIQALMVEARRQQGRVLASLERHGLKREEGR
jgi:HPt (histidine-containing phosphotransfer) domain-containing protein